MNIQINDYNGPLDLLLHLIKVNKMDIYDINIELITKEYLNFINNTKDLSIDAYSEYLVMASELIHLKSKLLLNSTTSEDEEDTYEINNEEDLRQRLLEYQAIKEISESFKTLEEKRSEVFTKMPSNFNEYKEEEKIIKGDVTLDDLLNAFEEFLKRQKLKEPLNTTVTKRELSVEERCQEVRNIINKKGKIKFLELFDKINKPYVIVTFLSILDMTKNKEIIITQDSNFSDIFIEGSK